MRSWKSIHSNLRRKTADKLEISYIALDNRVLRSSRKLAISQGGALYKIATEAGIKSQRDWALLPPHDISVITSLKAQGSVAGSIQSTNAKMTKPRDTINRNQKGSIERRSLRAHFTKGWIIDHIAELVIGVLVLLIGTLLFNMRP